MKNKIIVLTTLCMIGLLACNRKHAIKTEPFTGTTKEHTIYTKVLSKEIKNPILLKTYHLRACDTLQTCVLDTVSIHLSQEQLDDLENISKKNGSFYATICIILNHDSLRWSFEPARPNFIYLQNDTAPVAMQ